MTRLPSRPLDVTPAFTSFLVQKLPDVKKQPETHTHVSVLKDTHACTLTWGGGASMVNADPSAQSQIRDARQRTRVSGFHGDGLFFSIFKASQDSFSVGLKSVWNKRKEL